MSRHRLLGVVLLAGAWLGCLDWTGPGNPRSSPVLVSDTASATAVSASAATSSADRSLGATSGTDVAYISLAPGTTPAGRVATVRNLGNGSIVAVPLDAGGFDPVAVRAAVGDTIDIAVRDASGTLVLQTLVVVTAARAPVVVRTNPPPRKRDVPLNAAIVIVFSEPIDPSTLTGESVRLLRGTATVAARLEFRDPARLTATLLPDAPLAAGTDYKLELTQGI